LHGSLGLIQRPEFHWYLIGPGSLYVFDKIYTYSRRGRRLLASATLVQPLRLSPLQGVIRVTFAPPPGFRFTAGQYCQISCPEVGGEYHPFSISSAPQMSEDLVSVHLRVLGRWTTKLALLAQERSKFVSTSPYSKISLFFDGPYGHHTQHWNRYKIAVMLCGGFGVTPFCSILTSMSQRIRLGGKLPFYKMYFVWVERTHENWDWMLQAIRQLESDDLHAVMEKANRLNLSGKQLEEFKRLESKFQSLLCLTGVARKVDLRLALVRALDHALQQREQTNILGIRGNMFYGRPDLRQILAEIAAEVSVQNDDRHRRAETRVDTIGVFSCGGTAFVDGVNLAISRVNADPCDVKLVHHRD